MDAAITDECVGGAIVVFAKCPIAGASKTRLAPLLGDDGAAALARAMLSDVLVSISGYPPLRNTLKVLVYAPGTAPGEAQMTAILQALQFPIHKGVTTTLENEGFDGSGWVLLPMKSSSAANGNKEAQSEGASKSDLTSSSLGDKLADALVRVRGLLAKGSLRNNPNKAVLFLGMDAPELPLEEIAHGLQLSSGNGKAHMCPANDGGYGLLSVPKHAPSDEIFSSVRWSDPLTAVSQLKALTDNGVDVSIGKLMYDIDEPADVQELAKRLAPHPNKQSNIATEVQTAKDALATQSSGISTICPAGAQRSIPHHTRKALVDMNIIANDC
ncbi:hypothetical protein ACHAXT_002241 [Thalassiosira profunda]